MTFTNPHGESQEFHSRRLEKKYRITSRFYDILDYPWEVKYRRWRPKILSDVSGKVLEAGVGTGRNLSYYSSEVDLTAVDLSESMLHRAQKRSAQARCKVDFRQCDASRLSECSKAWEHSFDWYISTFMFCVLPEPLQRPALLEMARVLRVGGRFRLVEMIYSKDSKQRLKQRIFAPFVEKIYGARFDRNTLAHIGEIPQLRVTQFSFLEADTYLLIEGERIA